MLCRGHWALPCKEENSLASKIPGICCAVIFSISWVFCCHQTVLARLQDQSSRAASANGSSVELLYNVGPTQCGQLVRESANGCGSPLSRFESPDTKKPITGHTSLSPAELVLPSSWWSMQDLIVYILLRLRGPSVFPTYRIYYYSWSSPLTT